MKVSCLSKWLKRYHWRILLTFAGTGAGIYFALNWLLSINPFPVERLEASPESGILVDRYGRVLTRTLTKEEQWRLPISLKEISPWLMRATIAVEDERFRFHSGVDFVSVARASFQNIFALDVVSGASTLDMQLCRMLEPRPRTFGVKLSEAARAWQAVEYLSKDEILQAYLNLAPYGGNLNGVEAASRRYFGKPSKELSLTEAALLAGIPQSPSRLRPDRFPEAARRRRDKVLERMFSEGMISRPEADDAMCEPVRLETRSLTGGQSRHFVMEALRRRPSGGQTFFDLTLQAEVEHLLLEHAKNLPSASEVATVVIEIESGGLMAMVGGVNFDDPNGGQVNAALAWRSPGSTLKPFVYGTAASERRLDGETILSDAPVSFGGWAPGNFDRTFSGEVCAGDALRRSLNLPALQVAREVGAAKAAGMAEGCGVRFKGDPVGRGGLAFVLGSVETRLLDLTNAYATLGRSGVRRNIRTFLDEPAVDSRILDSDVCAWLGHELSSWRFPSTEFDNLSLQSTPWFMRKTGTSSGRRDAWAVGHNGKYAVGVWVGRLSGMGDEAYVGAKVAEPVLARIFDLSKIRVTEAPEKPIPWTVSRPIPLPGEDLKLSILSPESGAVYRKLDDFLEIRPKANLDGELLWFLNGSPLVGTAVNRTAVGIGRHELLCLMPTGTYARSRFEVR
mgnify:FL=1